MTGFPTFLVIDTADAQGYHEEVKIRIPDGSFDGTVLPTAGKVSDIIAALFGTTKLSDQIVYGYRIEVHNDPDDGITGGTGNVATAMYGRFRQEIAVLDWPFALPGLNKANVVFDPTNPNSFSTSGALFTAARAALTAAGIQ